MHGAPRTDIPALQQFTPTFRQSATAVLTCHARINAKSVMLDQQLRAITDPLTKPVAAGLTRLNIPPSAITLAGLLCGLAGCLLLANSSWLPGLSLLLLNRLCDGLDGQVARMTRPSPFGGYLDSVCDQIFYAAVPLSFGFAADENLRPALLLLFSFFASSGSFLAWAAIATAYAADKTDQPAKSFTYSAGLMEGAETILFFALFCLFPADFPTLAAVFAALCGCTALQRILMAYQTFQSPRHQ